MIKEVAQKNAEQVASILSGKDGLQRQEVMRPPRRAFRTLIDLIQLFP
jgi:hypothetical protein